MDVDSSGSDDDEFEFNDALVSKYQSASMLNAHAFKFSMRCTKWINEWIKKKANKVLKFYTQHLISLYYVIITSNWMINR